MKSPNKPIDENEIRNYLSESVRVANSLSAQAKEIAEIVSALEKVVLSGGTIYSCGNGGSTCDAMHLTEELVARYKKERPGIRAMHLCDASTITCWSNDYSFEDAYRRQIETFATSKDCLIVFSTSGNSENILAALKEAKNKGAATIALLGKGGGKAKDLAEISLVVASDTTNHIQEAHIKIVHIICEQLENRLY